MFSLEEFQSRVNKVRAGMSDTGVSTLVVLDNESYMNGGNIRYLTNFLSTLSPQVGAVVITAVGVTLCVDPGFSDSAFRLANQVSWVKDVVGVRSGLWGHELAKDIKKVLDKAKVLDGKIGVDGLYLVTEPVAKTVRVALSNFELVEQTGIVEKVRMVKSAAEFEAIREATRLADIGMTAFIKSVKAGGSVAASISEGEHAAKVHGAESAFMMMSSSDDPFIWGVNRCHSLQGQVYKEGDMVSCELNAGFQGYIGQVARSFVIGKASLEQKRVYDATMGAYQEAASMLKPGVRASELFAAGHEVIERAGCKPVSMRAGHGMGLTIAEGFDIYEGDNTEMQPGFYVMIHPVVASKEGIVMMGNCLRVTETASEELGKAGFYLEI